MDRFSRFNPKATLLFFACIIVLTIIIFNPVMLGISLLSACAYKIKLSGKEGFAYAFRFVIPLIIAVMLFNFIFSHYGKTVLFNAFNTDFTFESLFYGFTQGLMLGGVLVWFSLCCDIITSERLLCAFGGSAPAFALIFSMVLSFIPELKKNINEVSDATMLLDKNEGEFRKSIKGFSAVVTMTLENSIETADSMKARGFNKDRTFYSKYRFMKKDFFMMVFIILSLLVMLFFKQRGSFEIVFEPVITISAVPKIPFIVFILLSLLPVITDAMEDMKWHILKQRL